MTTLTLADGPLDGLRLYTVRETMERLRLSRTSLYEQIRAGRLSSVKQGRSRCFTAAAIADYIALLEREARQAA
ncbi:helix-turn-helix domain-containing protein [Actinomadura viridis]|uniref:helix-turn-helix domain-containing protein n=1 Tax=Actinomadura viridis TaxID=58110 RepID=UPI003699663D